MKSGKALCTEVWGVFLVENYKKLDIGENNLYIDMGIDKNRIW